LATANNTIKDDNLNNISINQQEYFLFTYIILNLCALSVVDPYQSEIGSLSQRREMDYFLFSIICPG
jgi:hypothetical protein